MLHLCFLLIFTLSSSRSAKVFTRNQIVRPLGGYERLLSRKTPNSDTVSLSHSCVFLLNGHISHPILLAAVTKLIGRHPLLACDIVERNGVDHWRICEDEPTLLAQRALQTTETSSGGFDEAWRSLHQKGLNNAYFPPNGPLWRLQNVLSDDMKRSAWVFTVNHGIDDQQAVNIMAGELLRHCTQPSDNGSEQDYHAYSFSFDFPEAIEKAVAPGLPTVSTLLWALFQVFNSLSFPSMLPDRITSRKKSTPKYTDPDQRLTYCRYFSLSAKATERLLQRSKANQVSVTNTLSTAMLFATNMIIQTFVLSTQNSIAFRDLKLRFLLSVGLRPFGKDNLERGIREDFTGGTVSCTGGAVDFIVPMTKHSMESFYAYFSANSSEESFSKHFWSVARECKEISKKIISQWEFVPESVRLFGFGMQTVDILQAVEIDARNKVSMGRGFSCGVSNVGVVNLTSSPSVSLHTASSSSSLCSGTNFVEAYYGTSHGRNGVLCELSTMSLQISGEPADTQLCGCLQFTEPLISSAEADFFTTALIKILNDKEEE